MNIFLVILGLLLSVALLANVVKKLSGGREIVGENYKGDLAKGKFERFDGKLVREKVGARYIEGEWRGRSGVVLDGEGK